MNVATIPARNPDMATGPDTGIQAQCLQVSEPSSGTGFSSSADDVSGSARSASSCFARLVVGHTAVKHSRPRTRTMPVFEKPSAMRASSAKSPVSMAMR